MGLQKGRNAGKHSSNASGASPFLPYTIKMHNFHTALHYALCLQTAVPALYTLRQAKVVRLAIRSRAESSQKTQLPDTPVPDRQAGHKIPA